MVLYFEELKGTNLKKVINAKRVSRQYHNKNLSGGNFGINIRLQNGKLYNLNGVYDTKRIVRCLSFGEGYSLGAKIIRNDNYASFSFNDLKQILKSKLGVAPKVIRTSSNRDKDATVSIINGINFVDFTMDSTHPPSGMTEARAKAKEIISTKSENLKRQGIK